MVDSTQQHALMELRSQLETERAAHERTKTELALTEVAYRQFVPVQFMTLMGANSILHARLGQHTEQVLTVLFSDIRNFTSLSESMTPDDNFRFLNSYMSVMEPVIARFGGFVDKFMGDGIMALFAGTTDDAMRAAIGMLLSLERYNQGRHRARYFPIGIGIGLNTGITMLGTVGGENRMDTTAIGDTVNLASRLETATKVYGVPLLISDHTLYGLENASNYCIRLIDRIHVKGKTHPQSVHEVYDADPERLRNAKTTIQPVFGEAVACYHLRKIERALELFLQCHRLAPEDSVVSLYVHRCEHYLAHGSHEDSDELDKVTEWNDKLVVEIPEIDAQHREMLGKMHQLSDAYQAGDMQQVQSDLNTLGEGMTQHFKQEEQIMAETQYPFADQHKKEHAAFLRYYTLLCEEIANTPAKSAYVTFRIRMLLIDWLINHTTQTDRHLGHYLRNPHISNLEFGF